MKLRILVPIFVILLLTFCGCATVKPPVHTGKEATYIVRNTGSLASRFAPVFRIEKNDLSFNRLGSPSARFDDNGREEIFVDPDKPAVYFQVQPFQTAKGRYKNIIYRIHFEKVPYGAFPWHITAGRNVGLLVLITLDDKERPLLITTVHTCGCFLAMIPTSFLPQEAFPSDWRGAENQIIYGESLPSYLAMPNMEKADSRLMIFLRSETHRVKDIQLAAPPTVRGLNTLIDTPLLPIKELYHLPLGDGFTSFFETEGAGKGYVKGSRKPLERLLMSWWVFAWRIGEDKDLYPDENQNSMFFTSLKFWARQESNMWNFPRFLKHWGWKL